MAYISDNLEAARAAFRRAIDMEKDVRAKHAYSSCHYRSTSFFTAPPSHRSSCILSLQNPEFLDGYGAFLAECGPRSEAITVLQRACELAPNHGFEKFM